MGLLDIVPAGVIYGDHVLALFKHAQKHEFAIPAVNVTSSSTIIACLEAAKEAKAPIILQISQGGAAFFAGKSIPNDKQQASIAGAIAAAHFVRSLAPAYGIPVVLHTDHCAKKLTPWLDGMLDEDERHFAKHGVPLFSSHMVDFSEQPKEENIALTRKYLERAAPLKQWLEMEIGITGGEEDGVDNTHAKSERLYTQPIDVWDVYRTLSAVSPYFSIAAAFGNVHGVYAPGNVKLRPELLGEHQAFVRAQLKTAEEKPVFLVFHGGSGSADEEYKEAIKFGVVKTNVDTDLQYAYLTGIRDYILKQQHYLLTQVGNPEGPDKPNKKYYDPRVWVREGEVTMRDGVHRMLALLGTVGKL